jgi:oxygen-dependent protoporphyrinogen oxidase
MPYDVIVVGGGITGLVTSFYLTLRGKRVLLLEKSHRWGGNIRTISEGGYIFEEGPQTILANSPAVWDLIKKLNAPLRKADSSSQLRFIYKGGKLIPIPLKPWEFFTSSLVSFKGKLRLLKEFFVKPSPKEDESVAEFTVRHFGEEFLKYFVQPFVSGIYAGDARKLSVRYAFPKLYEMERRYGSLLKAFLKEKRVAPKGELISFAGGLSTLVKLLAEKIEEKRLNTEVLSIEKSGNLYKVKTAKGNFFGRKVVLTTPAYVSARLLEKIFPPAKEFERIAYPSVAVVSLSFPKIGLKGFGFLTAEGLKILGAIFVSSLFKNRCPEGEDCVSVFLCGETQREICQLGEEEILKTAQGEIKKVFPQIKEFKYQRLTLWERSIPQYTVGYGKFYRLAEELEKREPNLILAGNFLGGSSLAKCIEKAKKLGETL